MDSALNLEIQIRNVNKVMNLKMENVLFCNI